ncbi:hypothetical protein JWJ90_05375 [Desulfobulbus rhabdoformis]|jgi:hypothetical protein|uniref:hypothetical protein n=1 Tax=Desulfobulbus rhabdoformis TaxID=34032 RepID=UPI001962FDA1|nr:hypothetical protein [Desulfobulbus rhabdoformis]MBM9613717.1 hypothetical protein [Desulfobulbus rhabdoformis]
MRKIPCELTLGNGGDIVVMVELDDAGTLKVPRHATYGTFEEGVLSYRIMRPEDAACVQQEIWVEK